MCWGGAPVDFDEPGRLERLPDTDLMEAARRQGIQDLSEVDLAVLENDGSLAFFRRSPDTSR